MGKRSSAAGIIFLVLTIAPRSATAGGVHPVLSAATPTLSANKNAPSPPALPDDDSSTPAKTVDPSHSNTASSDPSADPVGDETLLLDVRVNGQPIGKIGEFVMRRGKLMVRPSELRDLGFRVPDAIILGSHDLIELSSIRGLAWSLDEKNLLLNITASNNLLQATVLQPVGLQAMLAHREIESGTGITLNYDTVGTYSGGQLGGTGSVDLRVFSRWGVASSDWLGYAGASLDSGSPSNVRLDSSYSYADVNSMRRYTLGDYITSSLSWNRAIRVEGVQVNSDFSMRPDLITFPMPTLSGSAAVPSTVEVLMDGNVAATSDVGAGPFQIPQLPVVSGAGTISMTVTNAMGQQVTVTQPFYASSSLLAPGLQTFAVGAGMVRRNWGSASYDYGKFAGAGMFRRGLTSKFTIEASAEGTPGTVLAGAGAVQQIGHLGVINFAAAGSSGWGHSGAQFAVGAQRIGRVFSLGGSAILATQNYRDVAAMNGDGIPRKQINGFTSLYSKHFGSLGAAYGGIDQDAPPVQINSVVIAAQHSHIVSASYSILIHHVTFYASEFKNVSGSPGSSSGLQAGIMIPFGKRSSVNVSGTSDGTAQVQAQQSAAQIGQWGYNAYASAGDSQHEFGQVQYKSSVGLLTAGVDESSGITTLRLETQGAFSLADRSVFPSNTIFDSFAIVDTNPVAHVHVLQENRDVGTTNSSGRLLVPDMRSFDLNHIAISATDIPADVAIDTATREMRPQDRSGIVVKFPVKFSHGALLQLVDERGKALSLGSSATLVATGVTVPVGYDGSAYVEDLSAHNEVRVVRMDGRSCTVLFEYKAVPGDIPSIGPLRCVEQTP
ncbi:MAG: fimbria/pilus outer membrane usher protein [Terracidiphilus sp.]